MHAISVIDSWPIEKHYIRMTELDNIFTIIDKAKQRKQSIQHWQPEHCGEIDIRIASDGTWFHEGSPFLRLPLVKLLAGVLRKEGSDYYLFTPAEKLKIQVDDAPFVATMVDRIVDDNQSALVFTTNLGDKIIVDEQHSININIDEKSQIPRPYIYYRDGLNALIGRNAFFELINLAEEHESNGKLYLTVCSLGHDIELGSIDSLR